MKGREAEGGRGDKREEGCEKEKERGRRKETKRVKVVEKNCREAEEWMGDKNGKKIIARRLEWEKRRSEERQQKKNRSRVS